MVASTTGRKNTSQPWIRTRPLDQMPPAVDPPRAYVHRCSLPRFPSRRAHAIRNILSTGRSSRRPVCIGDRRTPSLYRSKTPRGGTDVLRLSVPPYPAHQNPASAAAVFSQQLAASSPPKMRRSCRWRWLGRCLLLSLPRNTTQKGCLLRASEHHTERVPAGVFSPVIAGSFWKRVQTKNSHWRFRTC